MFEKIKERLKVLADKMDNGEDIREEIENTISNIQKVKNEIIKLEESAKKLLQRKPGEKGRNSPGFLSKIKSSRVNIETLLSRGWNNVVSGRYEEAIKNLKKAKQLNPDNARIYNLLGWAYIRMEEYDKASVNFQQVLSLDPDNEMAQANLGYINYKQGLFGEAIERLSNIINNADNKQATLYATFYLGLVYYEREMYKDSTELLNKAITIGPNLYEAYYYLGKSYQKRGYTNLSHQIWEKLLSINKNNIWAKKAREEMDDK